MKKQLTYVAPLRAGIILGLLYGILAIILVPIFAVVFIIGAVGGAAQSGPSILFGLVFALLMPVLYAAMGFIGGLVAAALYNLIAKWTGGFEFEVRDVAPAV